MSKKTAAKTTKKPTLAEKIEGLELAIRRHEARMNEQTRIRARQNKAFDDRLTAIESRSVPAEQWKVGDLAVIKDHSKLGAGRLADDPLKMGWRIDFPDGDYRLIARSCVVSPTPAEIADHKAKEEQRALEAEWAKFDCLQEGDACHLTDEQRAELAILFPNVLVWEKFRAVVWYQESLCYIQREIDPCDGENEIPAEHFLRRAKGTIAKRAEDERAKQLGFGTRVRYQDQDDWRVSCPWPDHDGDTCLVRHAPDSHIRPYVFAYAKRHEFTVID